MTSEDSATLRFRYDPRELPDTVALDRWHMAQLWKRTDGYPWMVVAQLARTHHVQQVAHASLTPGNAAATYLLVEQLATLSQRNDVLAGGWESDQLDWLLYEVGQSYAPLDFQVAPVTDDADTDFHYDVLLSEDGQWAVRWIRDHPGVFPFPDTDRADAVDWEFEGFLQEAIEAVELPDWLDVHQESPWPEHSEGGHGSAYNGP